MNKAFSSRFSYIARSSFCGDVKLSHESEMPVFPDDIDRAVKIAMAHGAKRLIVFGSALESPESARDLDLAVEGVRGWDFFGLAAEMESGLGVRVDIIPLDQVHENHFTRSIRKRGRIVYERNDGESTEADGGR